MKTNEQLLSYCKAKINERITRRMKKVLQKLKEEVDVQHKDQENVPKVNHSIEVYPKPIKVIPSGLGSTASTDNGHHGIRGQAS